MLWEGTRFRTVYLSDLRSWPQELESENARLEKPLAEEELVDIDLLKGVNRETSEPGPEKESCGASAASFEASERRACWVVGQPRSSQRYVSMKVGNRIEPSKPQYSPEKSSNSYPRSHAVKFLIGAAS